ncbi:hypothetical protein BDF20DRAFT_812336 [Mycotypha africana]|uniref:uncharacterized protein n=1 Tax=Mycotypha africana TaxID=64632 RepID=UPI00230179A8|nr:uncharacterized protein BDF20DRAFT_812336 [Mycotypha africana]KAI8990952.1 hypothetical protein BDF20DRAFT_812336 [Mycotypha africana]
MQLSLLCAGLLATANLVFAAPTPSVTIDVNSTELVTTTKSHWAPQFSPEFPGLKVTNPNPKYNSGPINTGTTLSKKTLDLSKYPKAWEVPSPNSAEVKAVINKINWDLVPKSPKRKAKNGDLDETGYDEDKDPDCWWTATLCTKPKVDYIPSDFYTCPTKGDWGLTYDDGPFVYSDDDDKTTQYENKWSEPELYNFLAKEDLKASLFYVGSNVIQYPEAAKRALNNGHTLCSHTWSHTTMTTLTNEQVVAELYWSLKAIKDAAGVTTRCWRPPQGDVDDRVRAIAWQMGLHTVIWDEDTDDWAMPAPGGSNLPPEKVDAKFAKWIKNQQQGKYKTGIMVLEHELNHATIQMTEKWLPKVKQTFNVVSAMQCNGVTQPYWEKSFEYPAIH